MNAGVAGTKGEDALHMTVDVRRGETEIDCSSVKPFLLTNAERVKAHAVALARNHGRPFEYLSPKLRKEDAVRRIAERDGIVEGLVCVFSALEPCRAFSLGTSGWLAN